MRELITILAGALAVFVLAVLALPFLIDANHFRPMLGSGLQAALHCEVMLGDLSL